MYRLALLFYVLVFYAMFALVRLCTRLGIPKKRQRASADPFRVLFLEPMGPPSAGFRHRSEGWARRLRNVGMQADVQCALPFYRQTGWQQSRFGMLGLHVVYLFARLTQCMRSANYDAVVVRREVLLYNDYGDLFFEKWLRRVHTNLILDADDDIAAAKREPRALTPFGKFMLEHPAKFSSSLAYYDKLVVASEYLKTRFAGSVGNVLVVPTCVQPDAAPKVYRDNDAAIVIGWVGSSHNFADLNVALPALEKIQRQSKAEIVVVSNRMPDHVGFPITFVPWSLERERENFMRLDVGIMPVVVSDEGRGKGGFKLLQYMACGLVSVASAVTVNREILEDGVNGFLVEDDADWFAMLEKILASRDRFGFIGRNAARTVADRYSYEVHEKAFVDFLRKPVTDARHRRATRQTKTAR